MCKPDVHPAPTDLRIDLTGPLTLRRAFRFPLQYVLARKEVLTSGGPLLLPFLGLLALGVGFLWTSVWLWQVTGCSFAPVFTRQLALPVTRSCS